MKKFIPPDPDGWNRKGVLTLTAGPDGHHGSLTLDDVAIHIRGWRQEAPGIIRFEYQHFSDGWVETFLKGRP